MLTRRCLTHALLLLLLPGVLGGVGCRRDADRQKRELDLITQRARQLYLDQRQNDQRIWAHEVEALGYASSLASLVDALRLSADRMADLRKLSFGALEFRMPGRPEPLPWGVERAFFTGERTVWGSEQWQRWIDELRSGKTAIDYFSLKLTDFKPGRLETGGLDGAVVSLECHAKAPGEGGHERFTYHVVKGTLSVIWDRPVEGGGQMGALGRVAVEDLRWDRFEGIPAFVQKRRYAVGDPGKRQAARLTPLLVKDLDGDQRCEIVLGGVNLLLRNKGDFEFQDEPFLAKDFHLRRVAVLADFTGEGYLDLLGFLPGGKPVFIRGGEGGTFAEVAGEPWSEGVEYPSSLAVTDVDGDGDLDLWAAQHCPTYHGSALPSPIADANDGFPSRLFRNEGGGVFTDITGEANLGARRSRRTTSSAFLDFDGDGDDDLLVTSDYAGVELHENDGRGVFRDITESTFGEWRLLGLSSAVGHFDAHEGIDVFAGGRWSVAMQRIDGLGLERIDFPDFRPVAVQMASGNQLFLSQRDYEAGPFNREAKNTGWTNSATAADFDNDADDDLYLTAGHLTGRSVVDFDSQFWRHDIYLGGDIQNEVLRAYFQNASLAPRLAALRKGEISWYGYEPNRLEVNDADGFIELGYLHGTGLIQDSPAALAADLNNDGRMDLLTVSQRSFRSDGRLLVEQSLVIYENRLDTAAHWLGIHLAPNAPGFSVLGALVRLVGDFGVRERFLHTGLTPSVQGPSTAHFGLGGHEKVEYCLVRWGNGHEQILVEPALDRYHTVSPRLDFTPIPDPEPPQP